MTLGPAPTKKLLPSDAQILQVRKLGQLGELIQQGGQKIVEKIQKIGQRIRDFFSNLRPRQEA